MEFVFRDESYLGVQLSAELGPQRPLDLAGELRCTTLSRRARERQEILSAFNCVRVWLGYGAYKVDPQLLANNFRRVMDICAELELLVIPVLFSVWRGDPPFDFIALDELVDSDFKKDFADYLRHIVGPHVGHKSILAWDLCNEPSEGNILGREHQAQAAWMKFVHESVKAIDPCARTCIGTVADFGWGQSVADYCDVLTPHLYGYAMWKIAFDAGRIRTDFETWFECILDQYVLATRLLNASAKPGGLDSCLTPCTRALSRICTCRRNTSQLWERHSQIRHPWPLSTQLEACGLATTSTTNSARPADAPEAAASAN